MVRVEFLGPIAKEPIELDIDNLSQLSDILKADEELKQWLQNSAVAINDTLVKDKNASLKDGDKISLLPPVCGG
jgi:molybdopterin synthase sulfur carrier subunit